MLRNTTILLLTLAGLSLGPGCQNGSSAPPISGGADQVTAQQMADVALESDRLTEQVLNAEFTALDGAAKSGGSGIVTQDVTFSRTRSCPAGGTVAVAGTIHRTFDRATHEMEAESAGNRTRADCAFRRGEFTVTVNGTAEWDTFRRRLEGQPDGLQTSHYSGAFAAIRSDGAERSCAFDFTVVRDPESHTRTLDGTICGTEIHRSVTWSHGE